MNIKGLPPKRPETSGKYLQTAGASQAACRRPKRRALKDDAPFYCSFLEMQLAVVISLVIGRSWAGGGSLDPCVTPQKDVYLRKPVRPAKKRPFISYNVHVPRATAASLLRRTPRPSYGHSSGKCHQVPKSGTCGAKNMPSLLLPTQSAFFLLS